tara:strand:+ start:12238 stop:12624 length:387 start_codon:yes stop_codon:yes gene_type:complete
MKKEKQFSDQEIDDFLSQTKVPLGKDKNLIWNEEFESLINDENKLKSDITSLFKLNWNYGIAASIAILISLMIFLNPLEYSNTELVSVDFNGTEEELLADETMIESLFVDDSEFDDWFEERYVLNTVN